MTNSYLGCALASDAEQAEELERQYVNGQKTLYLFRIDRLRMLKRKHALTFNKAALMDCIKRAVLPHRLV